MHMHDLLLTYFGDEILCQMVLTYVGFKWHLYPIVPIAINFFHITEFAGMDKSPIAV